MQPYDPVTKIGGDIAEAVGYILGRFNGSVAAGHEPDWLVYWYKRLDDRDYHWLNRELAIDLDERGKPVIDWRPDYLYILDPAHQAPPPVVTPPVDPPPPVEPPPVILPPAPDITMTISRKPGPRKLVMDWFEDNVAVILQFPGGYTLPPVLTGSKGNQYGPHSCEPSYDLPFDGSYLLFVGKEKFSIPVIGLGEVWLHFERKPAADPLVILATGALGRARGEAVLATANHLALDALGVDGLFRIEV